MDKWRREWRWLPSSKITAVGISGAIYAWGVWILVHFYKVNFNVFEVAATQAWLVFLVGYAITEHRPRGQ
jgi:hypothetical protein